jgi:hypothetical protein
VQQPDAEGRQRRAAKLVRVLVGMRMRVGRLGLVDVRVRVAQVSVRVLVHVKVAAPPAHEQPHGERSDHDAHGELEAVLQPFRQARAEHDHRDAEREQGERVPEAP